MTSISINPTHSVERRYDIDCLRALAVLGVLMFHFDVPLMTGGLFRAGFLGVDIFFVISGYLITRNILKGLNSDSFSLIDFYARRARRLLPAFFLTLLLTALVALWLMTPIQIERLSQSILYTGIYASNFFFWMESGYFDTSSNYKPLLHTWSLAVEEQFYLFWPLLLLFCFKRNLYLWVSLIFVASLVAAELMVRSHPSAVFYLMPFRMFEFAIGAFVVFAEDRMRQFKNANIVLVVCVGLLLFSFSFFAKTSHIPGVSVLPMLFATALIIAIKAPLVNSATWTVKSLAWLGRVSYSMYLVHWPIVVFYRQMNGGSISVSDLLPLTVVTLTCTLLLYYLVEKPTQLHGANQRRWLWLLPLGLAISVLFNTVGKNTYTSYREQHRKELDTLLASVANKKKEFNKWARAHKQRMRSGPRVLVLGDSHNTDFTWGLKFSEGPEMTLFSNISYCDPVFIDSDKQNIAEYYSSHKNHETRENRCLGYHDKFYSMVKSYRVSAVIFSDRWRKESLPFALETFSYLKNELNLNVLVLGANQEFTFPPGRVLAKADRVTDVNKVALNFRREATTNPSLVRDTTEINNELRRAAEKAGVTYIDKTSVVCSNPSTCDYLHQGNLTYSDGNHWTPYGMKLFTQRIIESDQFQKFWSGVLRGQNTSP